MRVHDLFRVQAGHVGQLVDDVARFLVPSLDHRFVVERYVPVQRHDEADDLFLAHLHPAPESGVRGVVERGGLDEVLAARQDARGLRPADPLAAADDHQVEARRGVTGQRVDRRKLRCRVDHHRHAGPLAEFEEVVGHHDARFRVGIVVPARQAGEESRLAADGVRDLLLGLEVHQRGPAGPVGVIVPEAVGRLSQALDPFPGRMRQGLDLLRVGSREAGRRSQHHRRVRTGAHQPRLRARDLGDAPPGGIVQLVHVDEIVVRLGDGPDHFRWHPRAAHDRGVPAAGQERADAQQPRIDAVVSPGLRTFLQLRGGRAAGRRKAGECRDQSAAGHFQSPRSGRVRVSNGLVLHSLLQRRLDGYPRRSYQNEVNDMRKFPNPFAMVRGAVPNPVSTAILFSRKLGGGLSLLVLAHPLHCMGIDRCAYLEGT